MSCERLQTRSSSISITTKPKNERCSTWRGLDGRSWPCCQGAPLPSVEHPRRTGRRSLVTLIPHTTSVRTSRFECKLPTAFLRSDMKLGQMGSSLLLAQLDNKNHQYKSPADRASQS